MRFVIVISITLLLISCSSESMDSEYENIEENAQFLDEAALKV